MNISMLKDLIIRLITFDYFFIKQVIRKEFGFSKRAGVLDLGCGTGTLSGLFNKKEYLGVDIDKDSISIARKKNKGYSYRVDDATTLRTKKKYGLVLVTGVLHHLHDSDVKKLLETIKFHTKKNGKTIIIEAIPPIYKINLIGWLLRKLDEGSYVRSLDDYTELVRKSFRVNVSYPQVGGILDYGVIVASR